MRANVGDHLIVHGKVVGQRDRIGEIVEIRGENGTPPFRVRFEDGHEQLVFPGPDAVVQPAGSA
ncbi:DUF1918 domain-containing protein [Nonomuraea angiospora]|uniref:DUF1918 domain-containing protein n=1 Tax=Nonomuraea angiospora TaxID=46172 RepID=A0ABR9MLB9_9ACTN|nr:DUF1918 domain-containing protein [Nonomuraea angiospora]MBE1593751.1 hypothetical protein [Nonomuraea angiospora]MDX3110864.1 DUF1918 domain-containing protein [Nonomuraea angiospora]